MSDHSSSHSDGTLTPTLTNPSNSAPDLNNGCIQDPSCTTPLQGILILTGADSSPSLASGCNSTAPSNISFAPLPPVEPRKKAITLGVATRASLLRRAQSMSKADRDAGDITDGDSRAPMYVRRRLSEVDAASTTEDPFIIFGRILSGASKNIWRKVVHRHPRNPQPGRDAINTDAAAGATPEEDAEKLRLRQKELRVDKIFQCTLVEDGTEAEGGVWEEEVGTPKPHSPRRHSSNPDLPLCKHPI